MKFVTLVLILAQLPLTSLAETIQFSANVPDEDLAEEAVHLLHCLSERSGAGWEFTAEITNQHWLRVNENGKAANVIYHSPDAETQFELRSGEAEMRCERIYPSKKAAIAEPASKETPMLGNLSVPSTNNRKTIYWTWAAAFAGASLAGYFIWKSRQPAHRSLLMN